MQQHQALADFCSSLKPSKQASNTSSQSAVDMSQESSGCDDDVPSPPVQIRRAQMVCNTEAHAVLQHTARQRFSVDFFTLVYKPRQ
jgi:hypothetical protein